MAAQLALDPEELGNHAARCRPLEPLELEIVDPAAQLDPGARRGWKCLDALDELAVRRLGEPRHLAAGDHQGELGGGGEGQLQSAAQRRPVDPGVEAAGQQQDERPARRDLADVVRDVAGVGHHVDEVVPRGGLIEAAGGAELAQDGVALGRGDGREPVAAAQAPARHPGVLLEHPVSAARGRGRLALGQRIAVEVDPEWRGMTATSEQERRVGAAADQSGGRGGPEAGEQRRGLELLRSQLPERDRAACGGRRTLRLLPGARQQEQLDVEAGVGQGVSELPRAQAARGVAGVMARGQRPRAEQEYGGHGSPPFLSRGAEPANRTGAPARDRYTSAVSRTRIRRPCAGRRCTFRRLATTAVAVALAVACSSPPSGRPPDILLISLDTLRADRIDARREDGSPEMPNLVALEKEAVRFSSCFAPMAFTLPSHMTMMTGLHPETHYVVTEKSRLAPGVPLLAELLREHGYRTVGFFSSPWLKPEFGFGRGFDVYQKIPDGLTYADRVAAQVEAEAGKARSDPRPLFLFAHFFDAHSDFEADGNELSYYSPPEYRRDLGPVDAAMCDAENRCATANLLFADREHREVPADQIRIHFELYRRGVRYLDAELGKLFDALRRSGFWSRALVVVVADHGEAFREHGRFIHSQVYREDLAVPLLVRLPEGRDGGRVDGRLVGLQDLAPTLLAQLGIAAPTTMQGRDLLAPPPAAPPDRSSRPGQAGADALFAAHDPRAAGLGFRGPQLAPLRPDARPGGDARPGRGATRGGAVAAPAPFQRARSAAGEAARAGGRAASRTVFEAHEREMLRSLGYLQ